MTSLRDAAQQALEAMGSVGADAICEASHHAKKDQHQGGEPCPLQQKWHIAFQSLRATLAEPPTNQCGETCERAAAELRRLHEENQRCRDVCAATAEGWREDREALLDALKDIDKEFRKHGRQHWPEAVKARAAIAKAEETA